jgi:uncharacterized protein YggE
VNREMVIWRIVVAVLVIAVVATMVDSAVLRRQAAARPDEPRLLNVTADAYAEAEPDVARISLGIKATRPTPKEAASEVATTVKKVKEKIGQLGVAEDAVETSELYLGEASHYDYKTGQTVRDGYKAYHWLKVTLKNEDFPKLAAVCDGAVAAGATSLAGLVFEVDNDNALRAQALAEATKRAREKADSMAAAANTSIVGVQGLSEAYGRYWDYETRAMYAREAAAPAAEEAEMASAEAPEGTPEVPGKLRITCDLTAAFLLGA